MVKLFFLIIMGLYNTPIHGAQEREIEKTFQEIRYDTINESVKNFPYLVENFDVLRKEDATIVTFADFLDNKLHKDEELEPNFGEVIEQAEDFIIEKFKPVTNSFVDFLYAILQTNGDLHATEDQDFLYIINCSSNNYLIQNLIKNHLQNLIQNLINDAPSKKDVHPYLLHRATEQNNKAIVKVFINAGMDLNVLNNKPIKQSALHIAAEKNCVAIAKMLIDNGADVNNFFHCTPLFLAVEYNCIEIVNLLLEADADITLPHIHGFTPLHIAVEQKHLSLINIFLHRNCVDWSQDIVDDVSFFESWNKRNSPRQMLYTAIKEDSAAIVKMLIDFIDKPFFAAYALGLAIAFHRVSIVTMLIDSGVDIDVQDKHGDTPLHRAVNAQSIIIAQLLIDRGYNFTIKNQNNKTALQCAKENGVMKKLNLSHRKMSMFNFNNKIHLEQSEISNHSAHQQIQAIQNQDQDKQIDPYPELVEGFEILQQTNLRHQSFQEFVQSISNNSAVNKSEIVNEAILTISHAMQKDFITMLEKGLNNPYNIRRHDCDIHIPSQYEKVWKYLMRENNNFIKNVLYYRDRTYYIGNVNNKALKMFIDAGVDVNDMSFDERTLLNDSVIYKNIERTQILIAAGAHVNARGIDYYCDHPDSYSFYPLHNAVDTQCIEIVAMLIVAGADINIQSEKGDTPLHIAVTRYLEEDTKHIDIVKALLAAGANTNAQNKDGETPLHWCVNRKNNITYDLLIASGANLHIKNKQGKSARQIMQRRNVPPSVCTVS